MGEEEERQEWKLPTVKWWIEEFNHKKESMKKLLTAYRSSLFRAQSRKKTYKMGTTIKTKRRKILPKNQQHKSETSMASNYSFCLQREGCLYLI